MRLHALVGEEKEELLNVRRALFYHHDASRAVLRRDPKAPSTSEHFGS